MRNVALTAGLFSLILLMVGCLRSLPQNNDPKPELIESDIVLIKDFLDALYRPKSSDYAVAVKPENDSYNDKFSLEEIKEELKDRLVDIRQPPAEILRFNLYSPDRPGEFGTDHFVFSYDTNSGEMEKISRYDSDVDSGSLDMWLRIDHWPGIGEIRQIGISFPWYDNNFRRSDTFRIKKSEKVFTYELVSMALG